MGCLSEFFNIRVDDVYDQPVVPPHASAKFEFFYAVFRRRRFGFGFNLACTNLLVEWSFD
jgi:hypothetical protein